MGGQLVETKESLHRLASITVIGRRVIQTGAYTLSSDSVWVDYMRRQQMTFRLTCEHRQTEGRWDRWKEAESYVLLVIVFALQVMFSGCQSVLETPWGNFSKFCTNVDLESFMNWFDFGAQRSKWPHVCPVLDNIMTQRHSVMSFHLAHMSTWINLIQGD